MRKATIFFIIIIVAFISVSFYLLNPIVAWYVDKQIRDVEFLTENFLYEDLEVDYSGKSMYLSHFKYKMDDSDVWIEANKLTFRGVDFSEITNNKRLNIDSLLVEKAKVTYNRKSKKAALKKPPTDLNPFPINIGSVEFVDSEFCIQIDSLREGCFQHFNLIANDVFMNDFHADESFTYTSFDCNAQSMTYADSLINLITGAVYLSSKDSVHIKNIKIENTEYEVNKDKKFSFLADELAAKINVSPLIKKEEVKASKLEFGNFNLDFFYDKTLNPKKVMSELPVTLINKLPFSLAVGELILSGGSINYAEKQEKGSSPLKVYFTEVDAKVSNLSNDSLSKTTSQYLSFEAKAKLLDKTAVQLNVDFNKPSEPDAHRVYGNIAPFNLVEMNQLFKKMALMEFKSGSVNKFAFDFNVNQSNSIGKVDFRYENLKLLEYKKAEDNKIKKRSFLRNLMTNTFAVRTNNPNGNRLINGNIYHKNDPYHTVFNYWWKSVYSGFDNTINR